MAEKGTVIKLIGDKPFGFIRRTDGSELFFHFSKYPRGPKPTVGDELEFEVNTDPSKQAGKQDFADRVKVVKKGSGSAPTPVTTHVTTAPAGAAHLSPPSSAAPPPEPLDVNIELFFSEPRANENRFELDTAARVSDNHGQPVKNARLVIKTQYGKIEVEPYTVADGTAGFTLELERSYDDVAKAYTGDPLTKVAFAISITVYFGGKTVTVTEHWPRRKMKPHGTLMIPPVIPPLTPTHTTPAAADPALTSSVSTDSDGSKTIDVTHPDVTALAATADPAHLSPDPVPPPPPPEPDSLIVNIEAFPNAEGFFLTTVSTLRGNDPVKGKFRFFSGNSMVAKQFDGTSIGTGLSISYESDDDGTIEFLLNCEANQTRIVFKLQNGKGKEIAKLFCKPPAFKPPTS